jgi:hypothetical protein
MNWNDRIMFNPDIPLGKHEQCAESEFSDPMSLTQPSTHPPAGL